MRKRIRPVRADDEAKGETEGGGRRLDWALQVINTTQAALGQYEASASDWRSSLLLALGGMGRDRSAEAQVAQLRGGSRPDDIPAARISRITDLVVMDRFFTALYGARRGQTHRSETRRSTSKQRKAKHSKAKQGKTRHNKATRTNNKTKTHKRCSSLVLRSWLASKRILKSNAALSCTTCVAASCALGSRQREKNPPECHRPAHHAPTSIRARHRSKAAPTV